jgi:DNA repair protein RadD
MSAPPCRDYQLHALERAREAVHGGAQSVLLCMPTGTGKTRTAVEACALHKELGGEPLFVAPRRELVSQAREALARRGIFCPVRTIQELTLPGATIPHASMVVLDEARHYVAEKWSQLRAALPDAVYLGLDATPERGDGVGLGSMFDTLIEAISVKEATERGYLVPCTVLRPDHALAPGELAQDPVDATLCMSAGSTILFCASVEHAQTYAARLSERHVRAEAVHGEMPASERASTLKAYDAGEIPVLCNVQLLTEGWDSPRTETVVLASGCGTAGGYLQRVGRALRPFPGKERALVLDLRGVSHLYGEPDEERTWHLEGRACRRTNEENVRFCPVCGSPCAPVGACETCGYEGEKRKRKPRVLGLPMDRFAREHAAPDDEAAKALKQLYGVARRKNYRPGWAEKVFAHKYGRAVTWELKRLVARLG